jgi:hypothetical protein
MYQDFWISLSFSVYSVYSVVGHSGFNVNPSRHSVSSFSSFPKGFEVAVRSFLTLHLPCFTAALSFH